MITVEKDGVKMNVGSEIQASAFILSGWKRVTDTESAATVEAPKPKVTRQVKK